MEVQYRMRNWYGHMVGEELRWKCGEEKKAKDKLVG